MDSYANKQPIDRRGVPMHDFPPAFPAITTIASDNATVSSVITLNDNTTHIEVAAVGGTAVIKWIATSDTTASVISAAGTANFDHVVTANNSPRKFVVPRETIGNSSIVGYNKQNGLYNRLAYKTVGAASILTTQY